MKFKVIKDNNEFLVIDAETREIISSFDDKRNAISKCKAENQFHEYKLKQERRSEKNP